MEWVSFVAFGLAFIILVTYGLAGLSGAPWVPTWRRDVDRFLKLANVQPGEKVYDLGCGDGRIVEAAAAAGATAVGYEISLLPLIMAKLRRWRSPYRSRMTILGRDFWPANMDDANAVFTFLVPATLPKLSLKMRKFRPGTRLVNAVWPVPGWKAKAVSQANGQASLYLYEIGQYDS